MPEFNAKAGLRPSEFADAVRISKSLLYDLPPELQPRSVLLGRVRIIVESPHDYLERVARLQIADRAA